jgi:hypothetical protein
MSCSDFHEWLQQRLDDPMVERAVPDRHLAECPECRSWHSALGRLEEGLRAWMLPKPPEGLAKQIASQVVTRRRSQLVYRRVGTVAMAASLLLAVVLGYKWTGSVGPLKIVSETKVIRPGPDQPSDQAPSLEQNVEEVRQALFGIMSRTAEEAMEPGRALWPGSVSIAALPDANRWQAPLDPPMQSLREAQRGMSAGLEPVASLGRRFVNFFWQEIPALDSDGKKGS